MKIKWANVNSEKSKAEGSCFQHYSGPLKEMTFIKEGSQAKIKSLLSNTACAQSLTLELGLRGKKEVTKTRGKRIKRVQGI